MNDDHNLIDNSEIFSNSSKRISFKQIVVGSSDYDRELALRDLILRKPIGRTIFDDPLDLEVNDYHLGMYSNEDLIGILILTKLTDDIVKMRQVVVDSDYQKLGYGREMIRRIEKVAKELGYKKITLHSRKHVEAFYKQLGYETMGKEFIEVGMQHVEMQKDLV
jgi:predicted GNAT family N-acyltransferase